MPARNKISFLLLFSYALLLWHDVIPHHHEVGAETGVTVNPEHHADNDHIHYFANFHTAHPVSSSSSEIIHFQYQQARLFIQIAIIPMAVLEKPDLNPAELPQKPVRPNQSTVPIMEGIALSCGLRAPPLA